LNVLRSLFVRLVFSWLDGDLWIKNPFCEKCQNIKLLVLYETIKYSTSYFDSILLWFKWTKKMTAIDSTTWLVSLFQLTQFSNIYQNIVVHPNYICRNHIEYFIIVQYFWFWINEFNLIWFKKIPISNDISVSVICYLVLLIK